MDTYNLTISSKATKTTNTDLTSNYFMKTMIKEAGFSQDDGIVKVVNKSLPSVSNPILGNQKVMPESLGKYDLNNSMHIMMISILGLDEIFYQR